MKNVVRTKYLIFFLTSACYAQTGPDWNKIKTPDWDATWNTIQAAGSGAVDMLSGFAQGFGYCPQEQAYRMRVWNDVPAPILVTIQNITQFLGASLSGQPIASARMNPFTNTGQGMANMHPVCAGVVYLAPYTGEVGRASVSFQNPLFDTAREGLEIGGAGGTIVYGIGETLSILGDIEGLVTGEGLILDAVYSSFAFYNRKFTTAKDDTSIYHYRTYFSKGTRKGEFLSADLTSSNDFSGVFYNSSAQDTKLTFIKDGTPYTATLESNSFNLLSSTPGVTNSIRPAEADDVKEPGQRRSFTFVLANGTSIPIPISSAGIADSYTDDQNKTVTIPRTYTYEIFDGASGQDIGVQGLKIGNYDQPGVVFDKAKVAILAAIPADIEQRAAAIKPEIIPELIKRISYSYQPLISRLRDINPLSCLLWYQSADTLLKQTLAANAAFDYSVIPFNTPYTLWFYYKTQDSGAVLQPLTHDKIASITLLRPQIKETESTLVVFALDTADATKAQQFLDRFTATAQTQPYYTAIDPLNPPNAFSIAVDTKGIIDDSQGTDASGVTGYYLLKDVVKPHGLGAGPFYYTVLPSFLVLSQLAGALGPYLTPATYGNKPETLNKTLMDPIISWITYYVANKQKIEGLNIIASDSPNLEQAIPELTSYLQQNGTEDAKKNIRLILYNFIFGSTSISKPPIIWQTGNSSFTSKPDGWPEPPAPAPATPPSS